MKKKLLFLFGALILSIGGASAQETENLIMNYTSTGYDVKFYPYDQSSWTSTGGNQWTTGDGNHTTTTSACVKFERGNSGKDADGDNTFGGWGVYLGGTGWAPTSFNDGETHRITITLMAEGISSGGMFKIHAYKDGNSVQRQSFSGSELAAANTNIVIFDITQAYDEIRITNHTQQNQLLPIASITREVISDAVGKPTITAPATYDGEETEVTITPGKNTHHVKYTISGSNEDVTNKEITEETVVTLTGSGNINITAVGYNEDESKSAAAAAVTITYSNVLPSGTTVVWKGSKAFGNNWGGGENITIEKSEFADVEEGDYIFLYATHTDAVTDIGFRSNRNGWDEAPWYGFTADNGYTSGGNGAHGTMAVGDEYWWLKVGKEDRTIKANIYNGDHDTDIALDAPYYFKNYQTVIQGLNFTLTKVEIHKAKTVSEAVDNEITKYENVILNLTRSFNTGGWNTICLPFVPTAAQATEMFGNGYKLAAFTGAEGTTMKFSTITIADFEAGKPYLVKPTQSEKNEFTFFDVDITVRKATPVTFGDYTFVGVFTKKSFEESEWPTTRFVGAGNKLMTPNSTGALNALRAYFQIADANAAPVLSIDGEDGEATGIRSIENGQLTIDNDYYDLSGRRVVKPTKGVYILNGKKVILK